MAAHRRSAAYSSSAAALFVLHLLVASASSSSPPPPREQDRAALLQLKNALPSGSGELPDRWSPEPSGSHCSWPGVRCDARRRVVSISLPPRLGRRGSGELPPAVGRLVELKALSLASHGLRGEIPGEVWRLRHLEMLNLAGNSLRGSLPATFPDGLRSLDLSGNQLSGRIPPAVGSIAGLRRLRLSSNSLAGSIPRQIGRLPGMRVLELSGNRLAGGVPPELLRCTSLVKVDLSRNLLHGQVPSGLKELKKLRFLSLAGNNFSGEIPSGLGQLGSLKVLDLSSNSLSGVVPIDLVALRNHTVLLLENNVLSGEIHVPVTAPVSSVLPVNVSSVTGDSFGVNPSHQPSGLFTVSTRFARTRMLTEANQGAPPDGSSHLRIIEIASVTSASVIILLLLVVVILYLCTRRWTPRSSRCAFITRQVKVFEGIDVGVPITYEAVIRATGNFSASNCIGTGGFGSTYRAEISPGVLVAIKRLAVGKQHGDKQFKAEVEALGPQCRHPNLVTLIGFHIGDQETFLIYNYLAGGNLERFIQERTMRKISWRMLHKIALDIARALAYMHDECVPRILHRDVKPSNILLDSEYNAYLSDFGLARLLRNSETHATTGVAGTFGYVAPEYAMTCRVSDKADVYGYGVMLFELISDKKALDPSFSPYGNGFGIVDWASMLVKKGRVREFFLEGLWDEAPHDDLVEMLDLGVKCTRESPTSRPTMKHVVRCLRELRLPY